MAIQIQLPVEAEAELRRLAAAEGKDPATFALEAVQEKIGATNGSTSAAGFDERAAAWNRFAGNMQSRGKALPPGHHLDDSREAIYESREE